MLLGIGLVNKFLRYEVFRKWLEPAVRVELTTGGLQSLGLILPVFTGK
jgi:hypothetical protein